MIGLEVSPLVLFELDALEERLEVAGAEAVVVVPLDYLDKDRGPVLQRLGEDLQQVAVVVVVDQDLELLQLVDVLLHLHFGLGQAALQLVVVGVRDVEELGAALAEVAHRLEDVVGPANNL